ncbi:MAG: VWA domain-containing protein [Pseudomonadales bacterium]|nr:VWA domain-containing protein [Pseudomonadales bacterium]
MIEFAHPWMFAALLLPALVYWLLPPHRAAMTSVRVPFFQTLVELSGEKPSTGAVVLERLLSQRVLLGLSWLLLVVALAAPEWVGDPINRTRSARDLMIAVDISGSMDNADWQLADGRAATRLSGVRLVLEDFVTARPHDRLGLIVFADSPYLQAPFTGDHQTFLSLLDETEVGMAGQSTRFGDAVGLAIRLFDASDSDNRVLIVLTDGNDTGSRVPPVEAARVAFERGVKIYNIGMGDPATVGEQALDMATLARMSEITGGESYQALNNSQLASIYQRIAALEPDEYETLSYRPRRPLYHLPLAVLACTYTLLFTLLTLLSLWNQRRARSAGDAGSAVRTAEVGVDA